MRHGKDWRCLIGLHDWREVEMPDRDKCAECTRCGKRDWRRLLTRTSSKWRGGDPPAGGVGHSTSRHAMDLGLTPAHRMVTAQLAWPCFSR